MRLLVIGLAFAAGSVAAAEPSSGPPADPAGWLVKMSQAAASANYQGVAVYRGGGGGDDRLETFRVTHQNLNGAERERVQSLSGEPRDILKQDGKTICLLPRARRVTVNQPTPTGLFPGLTREKLTALAQLYEFDELGEQRVAGRPCRGIAITPRDRFRYGYEVWADSQSFVPLKVNLIGRDGVLLEQMMFTEVNFPSNIPDSAFAFDPAQMQAMQPPPTAPLVQQASVLPINIPGFGPLPPGFRVTSRELRALPNGRGTVEHVMLSDGLSAISIFSTMQQGPAQSFQGVSQIGAVHAYGRMVGRVHITVVGEAPQETVKMIGDGYTPVAEPVPPQK